MTTAGSAKPCGGLFLGVRAMRPLVSVSGLGASRAQAGGRPMHSSMIGKLEKARRYADEPWRVTLQSLHVEFKGDNDVHTVSTENGEWQCTCDFHTKNGTCAHV